MIKYELMSIVNSHLTNDEKESIFKQATECIIKGGGKIINAQVWLDKHKLAFAIKRCTEATYYLINFEAAGNVLTSIRELLRLNENILRFLIIKND